MASEAIPEVPPQISDHLRIEVGQLERLLETLQEANPWERCSIYRVPPHLLRRNENVYKPTLVSIGPYNHGRPELTPMDEHKLRSLRQFLNRSKRTLSDLKTSLRPNVGQMLDSYEELEEAEWSAEEKFLELMILDGCFVLEILRLFEIHCIWGHSPPFGYNDYSPRDPIFGGRGKSIILTLVEDFLLLENQLPFLVLERLLAVEDLTREDPVMYMENFLNYVVENDRSEERKGYEPPHLLDLLRMRLVGTPRKGSLVGSGIEIKSATAYRKAGLRFSTEKFPSKFLSDVKLEKSGRGRVLKLPVSPLLSVNEAPWFNAWAYEVLHTGLSQDLSAYVLLMDGLLQTREDLRLLCPGCDDQRVLNLVRSLKKNIDFAVFHEFFDVALNLNEFHRKSTKRWKKRAREWSFNLKESHFKNPWTVLSLVGALLLIGLSIWQAVYGSLSFYKPH
ncbi:hypothetical protein H6P81_014800 [Aristolochia fimbriata]|uniref:Uncharacterized protein n=1 Tax=Aristolochia fimbriata TaxID=158543 RepID=A0AAV7E3G5_ARIFI|nr:hypothetical protein H6P81_014800 [Aristolochia fimbriata]